jgi:hypothetical protein
MKYAVDMGSGARICITSFINIGSGIQKLIRGDSQTHSMVISQAYVLFFRNKKNKLKITDISCQSY